jgi:hypothetical protein
MCVCVCREALLPLWKKAVLPLTCALGPADQWWPRAACASISRACEQHADFILSVWVQMPQLVGLQVDSVHLGPRAPCHAVLDLLAHDRPVANDGVGVELDNEVGGACTQQLWGRDGGGRLCDDMQKRRSLLMPPCGPRTP